MASAFNLISLKKSLTVIIAVEMKWNVGYGSQAVY